MALCLRNEVSQSSDVYFLCLLPLFSHLSLLQRSAGCMAGRSRSCRRIRDPQRVPVFPQCTASLRSVRYEASGGEKYEREIISEPPRVLFVYHSLYRLVVLSCYWDPPGNMRVPSRCYESACRRPFQKGRDRGGTERHRTGGVRISPVSMI